MHPAFLIAAAMISAAPGPPDQEPLRVAVVDAASFPTFTFDVITPTPLAATELTAAMVSVGGLPVVSLTAIDPTTTAVALVIDDRSEVGEATVADQQAASVDLARNLADGIELAVLTASGLRSSLTADDTTAIEPVGRIVAGAPDVVDVSDDVVEAANMLASSTRVDRHLVVLLGADFVLESAELDAVTALVDSAEVRVHVVAPSVDPGALADLARASGGGAVVGGSHVAGVDDVSAAVGERYRAVATTGVSGPQEVVLETGGERYATSVDVIVASGPPTTGAASPPSLSPSLSPSPSSSVLAADDAVPATSVLEVSPLPPPDPTATVPSTVAAGDAATATSTPTATSDGGGGVNWLLVVLGLGIVVLGLSIAAAVLGAPILARRRRRAPRAVTPEAPEPEDAADTSEPLPVVGAETPVSADDAPERAPIDSEPPPPPPPPPAAEEEPAAVAAPPPVRLEKTPAAEVPEPLGVTEPPPPAPEEARPVELPEPVEASESPPEPDEVPPVVPVVADSPTRERRRVERRPRVERPGRAAAPVARPRRRQEPTTTTKAVNGVEEDAGWLVRGALRMSVETGEVWNGRRRINLAEPETDVLWLLLTAGGDEVSTESVLEAAGRPPTAGKRAADMIVARVKRRAGLTTARARPARKQHAAADHHDHAE